MMPAAPDLVIQEAARWIVETPKALRPRPVVAEVRDRFPPLDAVGACAAVKLANAIRAGGADAAA